MSFYSNFDVLSLVNGQMLAGFVSFSNKGLVNGLFNCSKGIKRRRQKRSKRFCLIRLG